MKNININSISGPDSIWDIAEAEKNETLVGSLHGTDIPNQAYYNPNPYAKTGSLHGPDVNEENNIAINNVATERHSSSKISILDTTGVTSVGSPPMLLNDPYRFNGSISEQVLHNYLDRAIDMMALFQWCTYYKISGAVFLPYGACSPSPFSNGFPSDRIQFNLTGDNHTSGSTPYYININSDFGKNYIIDWCLLNSSCQLGQDIEMIIDLKPKLVCATLSVFSYDTSDTSTSYVPENVNMIDWFCAYSKIIIDFLHGYDQDIVFMAGIVEQCDASCNKYAIPDYVFIALGQAVVIRNFNYLNMKYDGSLGIYMDISKLETQMWIYFVATKYIDCGHESIFFGDTYTMCDVDSNLGYSNLWKVVQLVRHYAQLHARRGAVICVGSCYGDDTKYFYYDPIPAHPLPQFQRQLIFDVLRSKIPYSKRYSTSNPCYDCTNQNILNKATPPIPVNINVGPLFSPNYTPANYPAYMPDNHFKTDSIYNTDWNFHILYDNKGGLHPQGWITMQSPFFLDFDNSWARNGAGCNFNPTPSPDFDWYNFFDYGYDCITWFALQTTENRNEIIKYFWNKIKCLNNYGHFLLEGRKILMPHPGGDIKYQVNIYRANSGAFTDLTGIYDQQTTIKNIWNGVYDTNFLWFNHNFTIENVLNIHTKTLNSDGTTTIVLTDVPISSDFTFTTLPLSPNLVFVGDDKMFFIASDGYIHGYIKVSDDTNGGTWLTVSPTYSAQIFYGLDSAGTIVVPGQMVSNQIRAKSDLVASPDGTKLLYIGIDNLIHGFNINDVWHYHYFDFMVYEMIAGNFSALNCLIYPGNDRIYYIGEYGSTSNHSIYGFQYVLGSWSLLNLAGSAAANFGQSIFSQPLWAGSLCYSKHTGYDRVYFLNSSGRLCYYEVHSTSVYHYTPNPVVWALETTNNLVIKGKLAIHGNRIFFVGLDNTDLVHYIYYLTDNGTSWTLTNITALANVLQPTIPKPEPTPDIGIAISPDGLTLAYFGEPIFGIGSASIISLYHADNGEDFYYQLPVSPTFKEVAGNLVFKDSDSLFYISQLEGEICEIKFEQDYCGNAETIINALWPV